MNVFAKVNARSNLSEIFTQEKALLSVNFLLENRVQLNNIASCSFQK